MPSTTVIEAKEALRRWARTQPVGDYAPLFRRFLDLPQVKKARRVMLFYGVAGEPDTTGLLSALWAAGKEVALPRCLRAGEMEARLVTGDEGLVPARYGIPAPGPGCPPAPRETLDVILAPHLCCDRAGFRLGHGGGYYDRFLAGFGGCTVALCPACRLVERVPREDHDRPVSLLLT